MKAYIATRLENHAHHNAVRDALARAGVTLSYDWTKHGPVWEAGVERIREVAQFEMIGVEEADIVIVIFPGGRGTHCELGGALALCKPVYLLASKEYVHMQGAHPETCAFYHHPLVRWVYSIEHLMSYVVAEKREHDAAEAQEGEG